MSQLPQLPSNFFFPPKPVNLTAYYECASQHKYSCGTLTYSREFHTCKQQIPQRTDAVPLCTNLLFHTDMNNDAGLCYSDRGYLLTWLQQVRCVRKLPAWGNPLATNDPKYIFSEICSFIQVNWLHVLFTAGAVLQFIFSSVKSHESKKIRMMWELYLQVSIRTQPVKTAVTVKAVYLKDKENVAAE